MPSLDYTLSFHIGLMARVQARREIAGGDEILDFLSTTQRKIYQAQLAFDEAEEIEDFQAVGLQCRAAMTSFARAIVAAGLFAALEVPPQTRSDALRVWQLCDRTCSLRASPSHIKKNTTTRH